jgi:hypothetical protein
MNTKKIELIEKYKSELSNAKGYAIIRLPHKSNIIQDLKRKYYGHINVSLIKTKLLEQILNLSKDTLKGKTYLFVLEKLDNYSNLYKLIREMDYYSKYKKNEVVIEDALIKPVTTSIRPGPAYKKIESILKVKLNKGFIEILDEAMLYYQGSIIDTQMSDIIKDLKIDNKPIYGELIYYKAKEELSFTQCKELNEILYMIKGLQRYIEENIIEEIMYESNINNLSVLLNEKKNRLYNISTNIIDIERELKTIPTAILNVLNIPLFGSRMSMIKPIYLVYLFLYNKIGLKGIKTIENEPQFIKFVETFFPLCKHYVNTIFNSFITLYGTDTKTTTNSKPVDSELDDLF